MLQNVLQPLQMLTLIITDSMIKHMERIGNRYLMIRDYRIVQRF